MKKILSGFAASTTIRSILGLSLSAMLAVGCVGQGADNGTNAQGVSAEQNGDRHHDPAKFFARLDRDGDGKVQIAELPARMQERMATADTDKDGVISNVEFEAVQAVRAAEMAKKHEERFAQSDTNKDGAITADEAGDHWEFISRADADKDGKVTLAEMNAMPHFGHHGRGGHGPMDPAKFLSHMDRNGDGKVEVTELPERMQAHLGEADTNKDGTLSAEEMTASFEARKAAHFAKVDANADGAITAEEAGDHWERMSHADADKDGKVTRAELDTAMANFREHKFDGHMGGFNKPEGRAHMGRGHMGRGHRMDRSNFMKR